MDTLRSHYKYVHKINHFTTKNKNSLFNHECTICLKKFHTATDLIRHQNIIHKNQRPYQCSICKLSFHVSFSFIILKY